MPKDLGPVSEEDETRIIVAFVFYDEKNNSVLVERRKKSGSLFDNKLIYPAGSVQNSERGTIADALRREVLEELGVVPITYVLIPGTNDLYGESGKLIIPFLVTRWSGEIPVKVQDTESELNWVDLASFAPELDSVRTITQKLRAYVAQY